jgi:hypothetical protein
MFDSQFLVSFLKSHKDQISKMITFTLNDSLITRSKLCTVIYDNKNREQKLRSFPLLDASIRAQLILKT